MPRALGCRKLKPSQSKHVWIPGGGVLQLPPTSLGDVFVVVGGCILFFHWQYLSFWRCLSRSINFSGNGVGRTQDPSLVLISPSLQEILEAPITTLQLLALLERGTGWSYALEPQSLIIKCLPQIMDSFTREPKRCPPVTSSSVVLAFPLCLTPAFERLDFLPCQGLRLCFAQLWLRRLVGQLWPSPLHDPGRLGLRLYCSPFLSALIEGQVV